jgi:hypothetical protein
MDRHEAAEGLRHTLRRELAECERSIRDRDPVRALNDLADAARAPDELKADRDARSGEAEPPA